MLQKGEEYYKIPFFDAGITFFTGIFDREVSCEKRPCPPTGWRVTFFESAGKKDSDSDFYCSTQFAKIITLTLLTEIILIKK